MDVRSISINDYSYLLPEDRIAKYPLAERDASKLLIYRNGKISEDIYHNIATHLPANSLIVFNNTKVIEARLFFQKPTGGVIEIFCLEPSDEYADLTTAMTRSQKVYWKCMIGGASKWKHGMMLERSIKRTGEEIILTASIHERLPDSFIIELSWDPPHYSFAEMLHLAGAIPLPPYIKRAPEESDAERYQTIYAKESGSVAAPTAGLHFTQYVFDKLQKKNINIQYLTLHVGAGTFKPVKSETIAQHEMHHEFIEVDEHLIRSLIANENIITVGTTSLRTLESLYWLGVKIADNQNIEADQLNLHQWEAYELRQDISADEALKFLLAWLEKNHLSKLVTKTQLLIAPGYRLRIADILITNFHQPQSTLLLLVAALAGPEWKNIYDYALKNDFRFLSYGDGCLIYA